jgi:hypothetical protein
VTRTARNLVLWLVFSLFFVALIAVAAKVAEPAHRLWKAGSYLVSTIKHNRSLPNPVVVEGDVYWLPLRDRVFAVPKKYVQRYGRAATNGKLTDLTLHMLLPNLEGYAPELDHKFRERGHGDRLEVWIHVDGRTQEEARTYWYEHTFVYHEERSKRNASGGVTKISDDPVIEWIHDGDSDSEYFYLIEGNKVKMILTCKRPEIYPAPSCNIVSSYGDGIQLQIHFSQRYESDWLDIADRLDALLHSFEQPAAAMPPSALAGKN